MGSKIQTQTNFVRFFGEFKGVRGPDEGVVGKAYKAKQQQQRNHLVSVGLPVGFAGHLWLRVGGDLCQAGFEHLKSEQAAYMAPPCRI